MPSEGPRLLHPASIVRGIPLRQLAGLLPALVAAGSTGRVGIAVFVVVVLVVLPLVRLAQWRRHTYELRDDTVVERQGVLGRQERTLELARIQQVEVTRTVIDRILGTAEVRLETAGEAGNSELVLRVVGEEEAQRLRRELRPVASTLPEGIPPPPRPDPTPLVEVPLSHVVLAAVTGSRLLVVPVVVAAAVGVLEDLRLLEDAARTVGEATITLGLAGLVTVVLVVVAVGLVTAAITGVLRDGEFTLEDRDGDLYVQRGLVATREAVVPRTRIQRITVRRSLPRRMLGYATVTVHSAGGPARDGNEARSLTIPLLPEARVNGLVSDLFGDLDLPDLSPHPDVAARRAMVRWSGRMLLVASFAVAILFPMAGTASLWVLLAVLVGPPLGALEYAHLASGSTGQMVGTRSGPINTATVYVPRRKAQGTTIGASWFQRRLGLATLRVHVAGPGGSVSLLDLSGGRAGWMATEAVWGRDSSG